MKRFSHILENLQRYMGFKKSENIITIKEGKREEEVCRKRQDRRKYAEKERRKYAENVFEFRQPNFSI